MTGQPTAPGFAEPKRYGWRAVNIFLLTAAAFVVVVAGMRASAGILVPFLLAVFVAVICAPLYQAMTRRRVLGLSPLVVILSVLFWGWVLGAMGMLIAVPLTMTVKIALESSDDTRWVAVLMSGRPSRRRRLGAGRALAAKPRAQTG